MLQSLLPIRETYSKLTQHDSTLVLRCSVLVFVHFMTLARMVFVGIFGKCIQVHSLHQVSRPVGYGPVVGHGRVFEASWPCIIEIEYILQDGP